MMCLLFIGKLKISMMTDAERKELVDKAKDDLSARFKKDADKEGRMTKDKANDILTDWRKQNKVVSKAWLDEKGDHWEVVMDLGGKKEKLKGPLMPVPEEKKGEDALDENELSNEKVSFSTEDGDKHKLYFKGKLENLKLIVSSEPTNFDALIAKRESEKIDKKTQAALSLAKQHKEHLDQLIITYRELTTVKKKRERDAVVYKKIHNALVDISEQLKIAGIDSNVVDQTPTHVKFIGNGGFPVMVIAEPLTHISGNTKGSPPSGSAVPKGWNELLTIPGINRSAYWVKAHLLNGQLHGPGDDARNLVPGTSETNRRMESYVESDAKNAVYGDPSKLYFYEASVTYYSGESDPIMNLFPKTIKVKWGQLQKKGDNYTRTNMKSKVFEQEKPPVSNLMQVSFNQSTAEAMNFAARGEGIPSKVFLAIEKIRRNLPGQRFGSVDIMMKLVAEEDPKLSSYIDKINTVVNNKKITLNSIK